MLARLHTQLHDIGLDLHTRRLRRQERAALRRLGRALASRPGDGETEGIQRLRAALHEGERRLAELDAARAASLDADRSDLGRVAGWMRPVVAGRGLAARAVLRHQATLVRGALEPHYEALAEATSGDPAGARDGDLGAIRAAIARLEDERASRVAEYGDSARPRWARHAGTEAVGLGRAVAAQLRSALVPKVPALGGMAMGWWIANTYTDSHLRSVLRSVGIGSGGTHVVSGSTYRAMSFWLPLLAAAVCAYLSERLTAYYRERTEDSVPTSVFAPAPSGRRDSSPRALQADTRCS